MHPVLYCYLIVAVVVGGVCTAPLDPNCQPIEVKAHDVPVPVIVKPLVLRPQLDVPLGYRRKETWKQYHTERTADCSPLPFGTEPGIIGTSSRMPFGGR